jgi:hypothetical protein
MISLEQIRALEARVEKAVVLIRELRGENEALSRRLAEAQSRQGAAESRSAELEARAEVLARRESEGQTALQAAEARASAFEARTSLAEAKLPEIAARLFEREARAIALEEKAARAEARAFELENRAEELRREQVRIEEGIVHALEKLDAFEDLVLGARLVQSQDGASADTVVVADAPGAEILPVASHATPASAEKRKTADDTDIHEADMFADAVSALDAALAGSDSSEPDSADSGALEEEAAVWTPTAPATQGPTFPGAEIELDIF